MCSLQMRPQRHSGRHRGHVRQVDLLTAENPCQKLGRSDSIQVERWYHLGSTSLLRASVHRTSSRGSRVLRAEDIGG